jgi:hypothetical protein
MGEKMSFVKACLEFFGGTELDRKLGTTGPHERKVEISEFQALTPEDKEELRGLLEKEGYDIRPEEKK